ncbi:peptide chain release factor N(5)-glutamine methyltransferase [Gordonia sp. NPDC003585]|uniref:peptide chain release factor N(5)-glutamine methyltransferase n=1 Tax=Gordonia sp. NPDC003585 TaxID=3154275 RepID=UPI0033AE3A76
MTAVSAEIATATTLLADAGIDTARVDADRLMADVLGIEIGRLLLVDGIDDAQRTAFRAAVARRATREPLQHIIGRVGFGPLELAVGPGVFIPRPETELILEWAVDAASSVDGSRPVGVADLCSGSGALALGIATMVPRAEVAAVEEDTEALKWLQRNVVEQGLGERVRVCAADVTDAVAMHDVLPDGSCDVIVSNPPYVPADAQVSAEVAHDPARAVFGGADGMSVIIPMVEVIGRALRPGGRVAIEHDDTTAGSVVEVLGDAGVFDSIVAHQDLAGRPRFVSATRAAG